ncbi:hypothetical protein H0H81_012652 [Sphagnurus paluster]|uniref:L-type lectin-like domain-containing protein n=1 Tax=Sphagnurus paluster TaxID=117069 RepID=A0A9P7FWB6_9AGAR|nr:hypothetical protein H0H81_012652 [Sphagnurus paluster]
MLGDGKTSYDVGTDGDESSLGGCSANYRRTNVATKLKVIYVKNKFLDVKVQYKAWDDWSDCIHLTNITLPSNPFLGFSAMTGDVSDAHDIISVTTYSAILVPPEAGQKKKKSIFSTKPKTSSDADDEGSWLGLLFKILLFAGVCAGGFYGFKEYKRRQAYGGGNFGGMGRGGGFGGGMYASPSNKRAF